MLDPKAQQYHTDARITGEWHNYHYRPDGGTRQGVPYGGETKEQLAKRQLSLWRTARLLFAVD